MCLYPKQLLLTFPERWAHKVHKGKKSTHFSFTDVVKDCGSSDGPTFCAHPPLHLSAFPPCTHNVFLWCNQRYQQGMLPWSPRFNVCGFNLLFVSHEWATSVGCSTWHSLTEPWASLFSYWLIKIPLLNSFSEKWLQYMSKKIAGDDGLNWFNIILYYSEIFNKFKIQTNAKNTPTFWLVTHK